MDAIVAFRHRLHQHPELSGQETETRQRVIEFFQALQPDRVVSPLGGNGVAFVFAGAQAGPRVLLRCDMDALPIHEVNDMTYRSEQDRVAHKCGHDGHMAIMAAVGQALSERRPHCGEAVLMFQPAEETGQGAEAVIADPLFATIAPDYCFALHNLPGYPLGQVLVREGTFSCASRGMTVRLRGKTAHAAQPETGRSPAQAMGQIIQRMNRLPEDLLPADEVAFATVVGSRLGDKAFGTAPGEAEIWITLRAETDETMAQLVDYAQNLVREQAADEGLSCDWAYEDIFPATVNHPQAVARMRDCVPEEQWAEMPHPFRWSEDFGHFTTLAPGALFGIGAGESVPELHHPDYDFPDALIAPASALFLRILERCLTPS